jgi:hypothetical protein
MQCLLHFLLYWIKRQRNPTLIWGFITQFTNQGFFQFGQGIDKLLPNPSIYHRTYELVLDHGCKVKCRQRVNSLSKPIDSTNQV